MTKLKVLALHSFRTSGAIFKHQVCKICNLHTWLMLWHDHAQNDQLKVCMTSAQIERTGIMAQLSDLIDVTYIDAPNAASGKIPRWG